MPAASSPEQNWSWTAAGPPSDPAAAGGKKSMIKIMSMWKRNPELTEQQCEDHYLTNHTELAIKALKNAPGFIRYAQNKVISQTNIDFNNADTSRKVEPEYDRIVELYFEDMKSFEKTMQQPEMVDCLKDHSNFMDVNTKKSLITLHVSETIVLKKNT
jgi:uncharacterized protein (TIGR02118 family)